MRQGSIAPAGELKLIVNQWPSNTEKGVIRQHALPNSDLTDEVNEWRLRNLRHLWRGYRRVKLAKALGIGHIYGALYLRKYDGATGTMVPYGLASLRVVTTVGVGYIVDAFQNLTEPENMKYHGFGTGTNAEAVGDSALQTELTTQYATDNTRPTGSTVEGASGNIYRTVGTLAPDANVAVTEHGIFSASSAGVLLDRSVFSAVNLVSANGDTLQATYELTFPAGS